MNARWSPGDQRGQSEGAGLMIQSPWEHTHIHLITEWGSAEPERGIRPTGINSEKEMAQFIQYVSMDSNST